MERIHGPLREELGRLGPGALLVELTSAWPAAVGDDVARNAWPARVSRDGTLVVTTTSSAWAFELTQLAASVIDRLRATLGVTAPSAVKFVPGTVPEPSKNADEGTGRPPAAPTEEDIRRGAEIAAPIASDDLRRTVARAAAASLRKAASDRGV